MSLERAVIVRPYHRVAAKPFRLEWELAYDDGTPLGAAEDVSDVDAVRVTAQLQVPARATRPVATVWAQGSGAELTTATDGSPMLQVTEPTGLAAGAYDVIVTLTRGTSPALTDLVAEAVLVLEAQP